MFLFLSGRGVGKKEGDEDGDENEKRTKEKKDDEKGCTKKKQSVNSKFARS